MPLAMHFPFARTSVNGFWRRPDWGCSWRGCLLRKMVWLSKINTRLLSSLETENMCSNNPAKHSKLVGTTSLLITPNQTSYKASICLIKPNHFSKKTSLSNYTPWAVAVVL